MLTSTTAAARHEFIRQAFLSDTEDWRGNACIGNKRSAVAKMNIVDPSKSQYLKEASTRKMSYYRERSLARSVSSRAPLVKQDGTLAVGQYHDQYYDKEQVARTLKASFSMASRHSMKHRDPAELEIIQRGLTKYDSRSTLVPIGVTVRMCAQRTGSVLPTTGQSNRCRV